MESRLPLIGERRSSQDEERGRIGSRAKLAQSQPVIRTLLPILLLVNLASSLYQLPVNRVIEKRLCREYYTGGGSLVLKADSGIDEELCKVDAVQQGLASMQGIMETGWIVGDFVMTIPLGFLAEKYGRRLILWLNLVPRITMLAWVIIVGYFDDALPTKAILAAPFLSFLGGDCVFNSITYALAAGLTDDYVLRASYFGYMSSVSYIVALLGPALASATMSILLWLPFWLGIILLLLTGVFIARLPAHSHHPTHSRDQGAQSRQSLRGQDGTYISQPAESSIFSAIISRFHILRAILTSHPRNFTLLLTSFFLTSLASSDTKLLVQYISKRYHWLFASAGYLLSAKAIVNFTLLTVIIPRILRSRRSYPGSNIDTSSKLVDRATIRDANICLLFSVIGASAIACSWAVWILVPSMIIYALGSALPIFTLSLLKSSFVCPPAHDEDRTASAHSEPDTHVFSIVMLVKTLGSLVGAPVMATLWIWGIKVGGVLLGLPYFVSATCYMAAIGVFTGIRV